VPEKMIKAYDFNDRKQIIIQNENDKVLKSIEKELKLFRQQNANVEKKETFPDGTEIIKKGNTTRIIRKRKP